MAFQLRHWVVALVAGMALLALRLHPALQPTTEETRPLRPEQDRFLELRSAVESDRDLLNRLRWLDSLTRLLGPSDEAGERVTVGVTSAYPVAVAEAIEARVRSEVEAMTRTDPSVDVGLFTVVDPGGPGVALREMYVGERLGRPYCLLLERTRDPSRLGSSGADDVEEPREGAPSPPELGPCAFFLRYGRPGPEIARWLRAGAIGRAAAVTVPSEYLLRDRRAGLLGRLDHEPSFQVRPRGVRCLEGSAEACREGFLAGTTPGSAWVERAVAAVPELWNVDLFGWGFDFELADPALFAELERAFGEERFARFWTSRESPEAAFHTAFGVEAGVWMGAWARSHHGDGRARLRAGAGGWTLSALLLLGALALAAGVSRRREVA